MPCLPRAKKSNSASHRGEYYNAQLRANLGMPERPMRLANMTADSQQQQPAENSNITTTTGGEPGTRRSAPQPRGRFPTNGAAANNRASNTTTMKWADTPMETEQLAEFFGQMQTLNHLPYAICGRGALVDHGLSARKAKQVSILVPAQSKDVVASWAKSSGWVVQRGNNNNNNNSNNGVFVGIPLASDGSLRQLRVKYLDDSQFEQLERVRSNLNDGAASVLSLTSQLDHLAAAWLDHYRRGEEAVDAASTDSTNTNNNRKSNSHEKPLREIARDILWTLSEMACPASSKGKGKAPTLKPDLHLLPTLQSEQFFVPFTERYMEARTEMARAGIDVGAILAGLRERRSLREHDEMLARFGAARPGRDDDGDEDDQLPFNRIQDLNSRKSVYTLATNISVSDLSKSSPAPLTPPFVKLPPQSRQKSKKSGKSGKSQRSSKSEEGKEKKRDKGSASGRRSRSVRVSSSSRPDVVPAPAPPPPAFIGEGERGGVRRSESTKAPLRRSAIPPAQPRKSTEWI